MITKMHSFFEIRVEYEIIGVTYRKFHCQKRALIIFLIIKLKELIGQANQE